MKKSFLKKSIDFLPVILPMFAVFCMVLAGLRYIIWPRVQAEHCKCVLVYYLVFMAAAFGVSAFWGLRTVRGKALKAAPERVIVMLTAIWGIFYMLAFPPMSSPDESAHFAQSYWYSNVLMGQSAHNHVTDQGNFPDMRQMDVEGIFYTRPGLDDLNELVHSFVSGGSSEMVSQGRVEALGGVFWSYLPQTIGITLARLLHLGPVMLLYLARICNFAFFLFCLYWAVRFMPFAKQMLGVVALFPMTLNLVASMNYDVMVLGLSFLFVAKVLELTFVKSKVTNKDLGILTVTMMLLAPIKVIYIVMAFLCFLIPSEKFGSKKAYWSKAGIMAGVILVAFLLVNIPRLIPYLNETNLDLDYTGETTQCYTLKELLASPAKVCSLIANTFRFYGSEHFVRMAGEKLGWLELGVPMIVIFVFYALVLLSVMMRTEEPSGLQLPGKGKAISIAVIAMVILLAYFSMLTAWTPAGSTVIEGVQGRYFLPVLPLGLILTRSAKLRRNGAEQVIGVYFVICLLHIWALASVFETIINRLGFDIVAGVVTR